MRTDSLIRALAADSASRSMPPRQALCGAICLGIVIAVGVLLATMGLRPHLFAALGDPRVAFKIGVALFLACGSGLLALRLVQPGEDPRAALMLVGIVPVLLAIGNLAELLSLPADEWGRNLVGANALACLASIPLLSLAPLGAALLALRQGAPENPGLAGAGAGLLAGAIGATLYAMHCADDSPFFVTVWYTAAIAIVVGLGAFCGSRCLRW